MSQSKMLGLIQLIAECHETEISDARAAMIESDLRGCSIDEINLAWKKYRSNPANNKMPTAAQLIQNIPDGHPSAQESFALLPRDEDSSVVWSEEMRTAYGVCETFLREGNINGAFFAYKETYERLVQESRSMRSKPKWSASFGFNKSGRELAVVTAIEKQRISLEFGCAIYPELEMSPKYETLYLAQKGERPLSIDSQGLNKLKQLIGTITNENKK